MKQNAITYNIHQVKRYNIEIVLLIISVFKVVKIHIIIYNNCKVLFVFKKDVIQLNYLYPVKENNANNNAKKIKYL